MRPNFLLLTSMLVATVSAQAVPLYTTSFESPAYTAGTSVVGVDGWTVGSSTSTSQTVTTAHASDGNQGLVFDNTGANTSFYSVVHALGAFQTNAVVLTLNVYVPSTNGTDRLSEVEFSTGTLGSGVLGFSIDGTGHIRMGKTWSALYSTTTFLATAPVGTFADRWLTGTLTFNPSTAIGTVTLSGFGGATPSYSSSFTAVTAPTNVNLGSDYLTTTSPLGSIYYDNLNISAVPEPSTLAGVALASVGMLARRRRKA